MSVFVKKTRASNARWAAHLCAVGRGVPAGAGGAAHRALLDEGCLPLRRKARRAGGSRRGRERPPLDEAVTAEDRQ